MRKYTLFFVCCLVPLIAVLTACSQDLLDFDANSPLSKMTNSGSTSFPTITELDKTFAVEIAAVRNSERGNASGPKITSGSYSDEFPGICFIWDSKAENSGYLKVDMAVYSAYENFFITTKESNAYWDFFITIVEGQQATEDGCYIFFLPHASNNKKINMVFISEYRKHEAGTGTDQPPETGEPGEGTGTDQPPETGEPGEGTGTDRPPSGPVVNPPPPPVPGPAVNPPSPHLHGPAVNPPPPPVPGPAVNPPPPHLHGPAVNPPAPPSHGPAVNPPAPPSHGPAVHPLAPPPHGPAVNPPPPPGTGTDQPPETEEPSEEVEVCN